MAASYTPRIPPKLSSDTASFVQRHGLATQLRVALLARLLPLAHDLLSSALVATTASAPGSAAANLLAPAPYLFSRKAANLAWSAALFFDAAFFLPRPPPRLPPPRP